MPKRPAKMVSLSEFLWAIVVAMRLGRFEQQTPQEQEQWLRRLEQDESIRALLLPAQEFVPTRQETFGS